MSKLQVCSNPCNQCLFGKSRIVSARRKAEILADCCRNDGHFICHKTEDAVCSGFYQRFSTNLIRIMGRLNGIEFVDVEALQQTEPRDSGVATDEVMLSDRVQQLSQYLQEVK